MINPTGKDIVVHRATPPLVPSQQAGPSVWKHFELNWAPCFLLHHDCPRSYLPSADKIADLHLHQIATSELAVDRQVEQRPISQTASLIEVEPDLSDLLGLKGALRADRFSRIPDRGLGGGGLSFRHLHDLSPMARLAVGRTHAGW